ncbi:hypothetical protein Bca52824_086825 [Brassica carinata]|uniref:Uncharacterized protein n=1 Tax=Brassica carinata TaxID=52824 RepID=A0A8X7PAS6_BRACI|nr:hypothetical protein Bca52824_086825 [Brassica carinata]
MPAPREETSRAGCSKSKRKRKEVDHEPYTVRNAILIKWSPFHIAAVNHLKADEGNILSFMSFPSDDDKISYLEHMIGVKIYEGL